MWRLEQSPPHELPDLGRFLAALNAHGDFFDRGAPVAVGRAPGRLDLMGGIADYSGALVLELPLAAAAYVAVQEVDEPLVTMRSTGAQEIGAAPEVRLPLEALAPPGEPLAYAAARALLAANPRGAWAAYVAGV
ncbi:MAG TPA: galactokinase family protein, partial [Roseiflexaceae bacterium]|nr:galactokinase family protein [Roseiflexaceae bacterium]